MGAPQLVPHGLAMLVAFNTVNAAGKTLDRIEPHREELHECPNGKSLIETTSIATGFLRVFRARKPPSRNARNLHRERRAEKYKIEGPAGCIVAKDE